MFPSTDAQFVLDLHHQRADELRREAAAHRIARASSTGRHRRFGRASRHAQAVRAPAMP
jgi:hypothetical protein